jgi:hypothetical protein
MTKLQTKAFFYQLASFIVLFIPLRIILGNFSSLPNYWPQIVSLIIATIIAPKFQAVKTKDGEKLFVKIIFKKDIKELK